MVLVALIGLLALLSLISIMTDSDDPRRSFADPRSDMRFWMRYAIR